VCFARAIYRGGRASRQVLIDNLGCFFCCAILWRQAVPAFLDSLALILVRARPCSVLPSLGNYDQITTLIMIIFRRRKRARLLGLQAEVLLALGGVFCFCCSAVCRSNWRYHFFNLSFFARFAAVHRFRVV